MTQAVLLLPWMDRQAQQLLELVLHLLPRRHTAVFRQRYIISSGEWLLSMNIVNLYTLLQKRVSQNSKKPPVRPSGSNRSVG